MIDFEGSRSEFLNLLAEFGEQPAFIRRAAALEDATEQLNRRCCLAYDRLSRWPRRRMANLTFHVAGDWSRCDRKLVDPGAIQSLRLLAQAWNSHTAEVTEHHWSLRGALKAYVDAAERFNQSWLFELKQINVDRANEARRDYNQYYPVEKDCAFGGEVGGWEFEPVPLLTRESLLQTHPLLPTPKLR